MNGPMVNVNNGSFGYNNAALCKDALMCSNLPLRVYHLSAAPG